MKAIFIWYLITGLYKVLLFIFYIASHFFFPYTPLLTKKLSKQLKESYHELRGLH
jgi:hypothetical protein